MSLNLLHWFITSVWIKFNQIYIIFNAFRFSICFCRSFLFSIDSIQRYIVRVVLSSYFISNSHRYCILRACYCANFIENAIQLVRAPNNVLERKLYNAYRSVCLCLCQCQCQCIQPRSNHFRIDSVYELMILMIFFTLFTMKYEIAFKSNSK